MEADVAIIKSVHAEEKTLEAIGQHLQAHYKITPQILEKKEFTETGTKNLLLLYLSDEEIKAFLKEYIQTDHLIGIIPNKLCPKVMRSYGISSDIFEAIEDAFDKRKTQHVDVLFCNGDIVFNNIIIGDVHGLNASSSESNTAYSRIKNFFSNLFHLSFVDYTLVTAKEQTIQTAATGIMILEHSTRGVNRNIIDEDLSLHDGRLNALILSPSSVISYLYYLLMAFFYQHFSINKLPKSIGIVSTSKLDISSHKPMDFVIDGVGLSSKSIDLEVVRDALRIQLGRNVHNLEEIRDISQNDKETIKIGGLPKGEMRKLLVSATVPIFKKADEEDFRELFTALKESAVLSIPFIVLMVLSTLLATTGLFQNSAPVIIGAMILAPLMAPIISLSMGVVRGEQFLMKESGFSLVAGIVTALLFSSVYTFFMPLHELTQEMNARLNPNILDLMVAVISGIAGAYANAKSEIAKSLAGVAIAVALVPPLSVTGIGIGFGNVEVIAGSFLLFVTNLVGITLAASMTFLVLGYAPISRAKKGIVYTSVFLALVSIPLIFSFMMLIEQNNFMDKLKTLKNITVKNQEIMLNVLAVDLSKKKPNITLEVYSDKALEHEQLKEIQSKIESVMKTKVILRINPKIIMY
ncbi:TIGR00341 family protein [bacterium]|nr:TIGR00341 family protein [bacterium]MBU1989354.1 TIGR00341 family protein [bacterium]